MTQLLPLPETRETLIVVGTAIRKPLPVLQYYLASLAWQELPPRTRLHFCFVPDFPDPKDEALAFLKEWVAERDGELLPGRPTTTGDFSDQHPVTHQWSPNAMRRVGRLKNKILQRTLDLRAEYVFLADADLILDRTTIQSLLAANQPITAAVYWTHWQKAPTPEVTVHAGPQVWLQHPYGLSGRGMDEGEFRDKLIRRELTQVWGQGACSLIRTDVLRAGVNFSPQPGVPEEGLMAGEDRHFCIGAERRHIPMYADPWPDIFHIYHLPDDLALADGMAQRLGTPHPKQATTGDLVSLILTPLEGIPQPNGQQAMVGPQVIRGRLGAIPMLAELEEAIHDMQRGETRIVPLHCPVTYPLPQFRGQRRLVRVQLVDCKPYVVPPVVDRELYVYKNSGAWLDATQLTPEQHDGIAEVTA